MERLTYRKDEWYWKDEEFWVDAETPLPDKIDDVYYKLSEFEDFMEEQGFESLEQLKDFMQYTKNAMLDVLKVADRWQELKKYVETLSNESDTISEDLYFIKDKIQELEKDN